MKHLLLSASSACALMLLSTTVLAASDMDGHMTKTFTGPYIGVQGGYSWNNADVDLLPDPSIDGGEYGIFAGMSADWLFDHSINYLGTSITGAIQVDYNWSDADDTAGGISYEKNHDWGVSLRPGLGFLTGDMLSGSGVNPYGILGYRQAQFEASAGGLNGDETYNGFELGIGTEFIAYQNIGARVEYAHTWYASKDGFDPSSNDLRVGLAYHF